MSALASHDRGSGTSEDRLTVLHDVTWEAYEEMLRERGECSVPRITYSNGLVEIMSPSYDHERIKSNVGRLVEAYCLERGIAFTTYGNWTIRDASVARGLEPDECWLFGPARTPVRPDLAVEVIWTARLLDKLDVYRALGVREVWIWNRQGTLTPFVLRPTGYANTGASEVLAGIDLSLLASFLDRTPTSEAILAYRDALRRG